VRLRHVARLGEDERHRVLGRRDDVGLRRVDDHDALARRGFDVDVVEADAGAPDDDEADARRQHVRGDLRGRADDQGVRAADGVEQLVGAQPLADVDLVPCGTQAVEAGFGDLLGDEDASHGFLVWSTVSGTW
jgi:hypothetical protein